MSRKGISIWLASILLLGSLIVIGISMDIIPKSQAKTIYVDDDLVTENATHKKTIQAAVDNASTGDTIFVYNGIYRENVVINKTLNLTGEDKIDTEVDGMGQICLLVNNTDHVTISNFNIYNGSAGIKANYSSSCIFSNNRIKGGDGVDDNYWEKNGKIGIYSDSSSISVANNNIWGGNGGDEPGGGFQLMAVGGTGGEGLHIFNSSVHLFQSHIYGGHGGDAGPAFEWSWGGDGGNGLYAKDSYIYIDSNIWGGAGGQGEHFGGDGGFGISIDNSNIEIYESKIVGGGPGLGPMFNGVFGYSVSCINAEANIVNSTLYGFVTGPYLNFNDYALYLKGNSNSTLLNSGFNQSKIYFWDTLPTLFVQWYLHVNTTDNSAQSIPSANVCIKDYYNTLPIQKSKTDSSGYTRWLIEIEYFERDMDGDRIGEKTYHTPHKITAWNETLLGYAEVNMNESKEINVVLDTPFYEITLYKGWNLVSLPLVQPDTSISTVLSSIAGNYIKVEWYNTSEGAWHTTDDDLTDIDHTMGFWIHMKTDDILIVTGDIPNTTSIQLYQGWNLIGNPSFCIHGFDEIFTSINGNYTAVQWFDAGDKGDPWKHYQIGKPQELNDLKYITCGRGYWIYITQDCVWEISNF